MIEINLIPDVKQELIKAQRMRTAVISGAIVTSIIAVSVVALLLVYMLGIQTLRNNLLDDGIKDNAKTLSEKEDLSKMLTIQNQLSKISALNDQKIMSSRIFDMLLAITPSEENAVQFSRVQMDVAEGTISLEGQTATYNSMEVFKKTLTSTQVEYVDTATENKEKVYVNLASDISVGEVGYGENTAGQKVLTFTLTYKYAPELFSPAIAAPTFKASVNGNVTDSYLGIPKVLFTEKAKDL